MHKCFRCAHKIGGEPPLALARKQKEPPPLRLSPRLAADPGGAGTAVMAHPAHGRALPGELVAILLAVHPARPLLAELIVRDPPLAGVGCAVAAGEARSNRSHLARHPAIGRIADEKLKPRNVEVDRL